MQITTDINRRAAKIKLVILDVDGVLTNGQLFFFDNGEYKAFDTRDGLGIALLLRAGIQLAVISGNRSLRAGVQLAVISGNHSESVERRLKKFGISHIYQGVQDKREAFRQIKHQLALTNEDIAYMGDDLIDLPVMIQVGLPTAVADADGFVHAHAAWVSQYTGGSGAVRELCELILAAQGKLDDIRQSYLR